MQEFVDIQNKMYGKVKIDKKGNATFHEMGRAAFLTRVLQPLDNKILDLELEYEYGIDTMTAIIQRGDLSDSKSCRDLANIGFDVDSNRFSCFAKSIFDQEKDHIKNVPNTFSYEKLGWLKSTAISGDNTPELCFRASQLITATSYIESVYKGNFKVTPQGSYKTWRDMVIEQVLPHIPLSIVLLCALSAVISGLLADVFPIGNGILHLNAPSSTGKSTAAYLASSTAGEPFTVVKQERDIYGNLVERQSILQSFSATENAMIGRLSGNVGIPIVVDELGKYRGNDMSHLIYDLYDGNSKARMNKDAKTTEQPGFRGTIITIGEFSILKKCQLKLEGLHNRVFEMKNRLTVSAKHSDIIKQSCVKYNGRAVPRLAHHIMKQGGINYIFPIYERWRAELREKLPQVAFKDKFIDNFPALYLTTAEIAKEALGLEFNIEGIIQYFVEYLSDDSNDMNVSAKSYNYLIEKFQANSSRFYHTKNSNEIDSSCEAWGRYYEQKNKRTPNGKKIVGEYAVYKDTVQRLLNEQNYALDQCIASWKANEQISYEERHNTRTRKIDVKKEAIDVYVFYVFEQKEDGDNDTTAKAPHTT